MLFGKGSLKEGRDPGKRRLVNVIKYEGPEDFGDDSLNSGEVFVWKHPCEDFNTGSVLIVHESQEAVFFRSGQALDRFTAGEHILETENIPLLRQALGIASGGISAFHCEIYFINKAVSMGLDWGTDAPIELLDPEQGFPVGVTAYGDFSLRVKEGRKLLIKLVGTMTNFTHEEIGRYFTQIMSMHIREGISSVIERNHVGTMHINRMLKEFSEEIRGEIAPVFEEYGLELNHFVVSGVSVRGLEELGDTLKKVRLDTISEEGKAKIGRIREDHQDLARARQGRRQRLEELKEWYDLQLITEEEYRAKRAEILADL